MIYSEEELLKMIADRRIDIIKSFEMDGTTAGGIARLTNANSEEKCRRMLIEDNIIIMLQNQLVRLKQLQINPVIIKSPHN
jgi:hypothetical protein